MLLVFCFINSCVCCIAFIGSLTVLSEYQPCRCQTPQLNAETVSVPLPLRHRYSLWSVWVNLFCICVSFLQWINIFLSFFWPTNNEIKRKTSLPQGIWLRDLHLKHSSPLTGIWVFWKPVLVVADPQIARRVLIQDSDLFRNRHLGSGRSDPIGSQNLFTVDVSKTILFTISCTPIST